MRNLPVVCKNKRVGLLQSIGMDRAQKWVTALNVSCGFHGRQVVLPEDVLSVADGFILVSQTMRHVRQRQQTPIPFVRDTTGMLVGRVIDYAIDENTLCIMGIEVIPGYLPFEYRKKQWFYEYSGKEEGDGIVIPAGLDCEPLCQGEENR